MTLHKCTKTITRHHMTVKTLAIIILWNGIHTYTQTATISHTIHGILYVDDDGWNFTIIVSLNWREKKATAQIWLVCHIFNYICMYVYNMLLVQRCQDVIVRTMSFGVFFWFFSMTTEKQKLFLVLRKFFFIFLFDMF